MSNNNQIVYDVAIYKTDIDTVETQKNEVFNNAKDVIDGLQYTYDDIIIDESNIYLISNEDNNLTDTIVIEIDTYLEFRDFVTLSIIDKLREIEDFENTNYSADVLGTCTMFMIETKYHFNN